MLTAHGFAGHSGPGGDLQPDSPAAPGHLNRPGPPRIGEYPRPAGLFSQRFSGRAAVCRPLVPLNSDVRAAGRPHPRGGAGPVLHPHRAVEQLRPAIRRLPVPGAHPRHRRPGRCHRRSLARRQEQAARRGVAVESAPREAARSVVARCPLRTCGRYGGWQIYLWRCTTERPPPRTQCHTHTLTQQSHKPPWLNVCSPTY